MGGKGFYTHRLAYELTYGPIETGMCVCHACDNRTCCNPAHLWLGTRSENIMDRHRKGRSARMAPERAGGAKLNWESVRRIRSLWGAGNMKVVELAAMFSVGKATIREILNGAAWRE